MYFTWICVSFIWWKFHFKHSCLPFSFWRLFFPPHPLCATLVGSVLFWTSWELGAFYRNPGEDIRGTCAIDLSVVRLTEIFVFQMQNLDESKPLLARNWVFFCVTEFSILAEQLTFYSQVGEALHRTLLCGKNWI